MEIDIDVVINEGSFRRKSWLARALNRRGIVTRITRGNVVARLRRKSLEKNFDSFEIPVEIAYQGRLFISAAEQGGGFSLIGPHQIVCGLKGKALKAYSVGSSSKDVQAYFRAPVGLVTICINRQMHSDVIVITEHRIEREQRVAKIVSKPLWQGRVKDLPESLGCYKMAAGAAVEKARCYQCRCIHYYAI